MKGFITYEGVKYYDYDVFLNTYMNQGRVNYSLLLDRKLFHQLRDDIKSRLQDIPIPKGSNIFVAPKCPIASEDLRHSYTIKRKPDTGDYNIFSEINNWQYYICANKVIILPTRKAIICYERYWNEPTAKTEHELIDTYIPDFDYDNEIFINVSNANSGTIDYCVLNAHESWIDFLAGRLKKPCVHYSKLDINNEQEITQDLLDLVYATGRQDKADRKKIEDFKIQLHALNQHNWRERPRTVSILLHNLLCPKGKRTIRNFIHHYKAEQDKPIKMLMETYANEFANREDFELCRNMVAKILGLENGVRFADIEDVTKKCEEVGLPLSIFKELFNVCVRIKDKEWQNEQD